MVSGSKTQLASQRLRRATLGDVLERRALRDGDAPAVIARLQDDQRMCLSYAELDALSNQMGRSLRREGVGPGDVVGVMARNGLDHIVAYYGTLKIGAAFTTLNPHMTKAEALRQIASAQPRLILADQSLEDYFAGDMPVVTTATANDSVIPGSTLAQRISEESPTPDDWFVDETDLAMIIYTSGTESEPKGVRIPHRNFLIATSPAWSGERYIEGDDRFLLLAPMYTMAGVGTVTNLVAVGATIVLATSADASSALELIESEQITNMSQTPTFYVRLTEHEAFDHTRLSSLRQAHTYGGAIPQHVTDAMSTRVPGLIWATYWGQTELSQLGSIGYYRHPQEIPERDPRWIGRPVPQVDVRVVDENDDPTDVGELICRSPAVMEGYHGRPDLTEAVTRGGWLRTGDIVRIDDHYNLFFYDRRKDVIKSGGMNVSSLEVETVLSAISGVQEAAVVGMTDPVWSEAVTAFIVPKKGEAPSEEAIRHAAREQLAPYKLPKRIYFMDALPRDRQGKVLKRQLREIADNTEE